MLMSGNLQNFITSVTSSYNINLKTFSNDDGDMVKMPDSAKTKELHTDLQVWDKVKKTCILNSTAFLYCSGILNLRYINVPHFP